uniref:DUF4371 domain-containing protein n=1 Tax=Cyprinus carpio TaxID=7962 RepID=A0A8C1MRK3_CYPCA
MAMQNMAFRGSTDHLYEHNNGNFLKLVETIGLFDSVMAEHIRRIQSKETHVHYLGKEIQNEIIGMLASQIQQEILKMLKSAKYFSLILDCTPDASRTEQMTVVVRFVTALESCVGVKEHFLEFTHLTDSTGAGMTDVVVKKLGDLGIDIMDMRGQGYDNGSNMRGKHSGVQKRVQDINPRAFYVPCSAHSLNLVVNDAASCCLQAVEFFTVIQEVYNFFAASTSRWQVLKRHIGDSGLTVKPLSNTRWESRIEALKPIRHHLGDVYDALLSIAEDDALTGACGVRARCEARGIATKIKTYPFLCSIITWYDILYEINITSKILQTMNIDIPHATEQLNATKQFLVEYRTDSNFDRVLSSARQLADELETEAVFPPQSAARQRKRKKMFPYEGDDTPVMDTKQNYRVGFFNQVLDCAIRSVEERFSLLRDHGRVFGFLYDIASLKEKENTIVLQDCLRLEKALTHGDSRDVDGHELFEELTALGRHLVAGSKPLDAL